MNEKSRICAAVLAKLIDGKKMDAGDTSDLDSLRARLSSADAIMEPDVWKTVQATLQAGAKPAVSLYILMPPPPLPPFFEPFVSACAFVRNVLQCCTKTTRASRP